MKTWLDLEARFRTLEGPLRTATLTAQWGSAGEHWYVRGPLLEAHPREEFELLSAFAGTFLSKVLSPKIEDEINLLSISDPKIRWYTYLKNNCPTFSMDFYGEQKNYDGTNAGIIYCGTLKSIAMSAAIQCLAMQASHPLREKVNVWKWIHDNYIKAILLAFVGALAVAFAKYLTA